MDRDLLGTRSEMETVPMHACSLGRSNDVVLKSPFTKNRPARISGARLKDQLNVGRIASSDWRAWPGSDTARHESSSSSRCFSSWLAMGRCPETKLPRSATPTLVGD